MLGGLCKGQSVLIHAGASGVGQLPLLLSSGFVLLSFLPLCFCLLLFFLVVVWSGLFWVVWFGFV